MNCAKDIIPVFIYKGVSKDNLRRIIQAVASEESRDSPILVNKTKSCSLTKIRQNSTLPRSHMNSNYSKAENDLLNHDLLSQPTSTYLLGRNVSLTNTNPSRPLNNRITSNKKTFNEMALSTTKNQKPEEQEKSFCIVITLKNNLKKQAEARRDGFTYLNGNISRETKKLFSLDDMIKNHNKKPNNFVPLNSSTNDYNCMKKSDEEQELNHKGSYGVSNTNKSDDTLNPKNTKTNYINSYNHGLENCSKDRSPETVMKDNGTFRVQNPLLDETTRTTDLYTLSPEENNNLQNYTCEPQPIPFNKSSSKGSINQVKEYIKKKITNKNLELITLSEKDLKSFEKVTSHSKRLFDTEKPVVPETQRSVTETNMNDFKNYVPKLVNRNAKKTNFIGNFKFYSNKQNNNHNVTSTKTRSLYERLQVDRVFANTLSSIPKKLCGLRKSDSELQRKIEVPPLKYIYMDRLNENIIFPDCEGDKNHFAVEAKNYMQIGLPSAPNHTKFRHTNQDFSPRQVSTFRQINSNTGRNNILDFPYEHFQRDCSKVNESVPKVEKKSRKLQNRIHKTNNVMKNSLNISLLEISKPNKQLRNRTMKPDKLPGYEPINYFLRRTTFSNDQVDSTRQEKQPDTNTVVKNKLHLKAFNTKIELKNSQKLRNRLHMTHRIKKEATDSLSDSFSTQYRKIENDRAHQLKQKEYARGIY